MCVCDKNEQLMNWGCFSLHHIFSDSGSFKTLDKDNNGTIKVNVQEVKWTQLTGISVWVKFRFFKSFVSVNTRLHKSSSLLLFLFSGFSWPCTLESRRGLFCLLHITTLFVYTVQNIFSTSLQLPLIQRCRSFRCSIIQARQNRCCITNPENYKPALT